MRKKLDKDDTITQKVTEVSCDCKDWMMEMAIFKHALDVYADAGNDLVMKRFKFCT